MNWRLVRKPWVDFTAFSLAYHPFQIPGGWAGDRYGPRRILTLSILLWAAATARDRTFAGPGD